MANFHGTARSNYFEVKDPVAFTAWAAKVPSLGVWSVGEESLDKSEAQSDEADTLRRTFGIFSTCPDTGCWPAAIERDADLDDEGDLDLVDALAPHLADGSVAVLMEAGAERLRYISGYAVALDNTGKCVQVSLNDIYKKARDAFGVPVNLAQY